jgi:hypothetical protein
MNNIFRDLIMFTYLMQSPLLAHDTYLGLIVGKHSVIFPNMCSFIFVPKTIWFIFRIGGSINHVYCCFGLFPCGFKAMWPLATTNGPPSQLCPRATEMVRFCIQNDVTCWRWSDIKLIGSSYPKKGSSVEVRCYNFADPRLVKCQDRPFWFMSWISRATTSNFWIRLA